MYGAIRLMSLGLLLVSAIGCGHPKPWYRHPAQQPAQLAITDDDIQQRVLLVGDAGDLKGGGELLRLMGAYLQEHLPERTFVVYLGDNVYSSGPTIIDEKGVNRILNAQLNTGMGAQGVLFIPGNHDWDHGFIRTRFERGIRKVTNEQRYIEDPKRPWRGTFLPQAGCPGPATRELDGLKLVVLDSEWWLQDSDVRREWSWTHDCPEFTEKQVLRQLAKEFECPPGEPCSPRILLAHHPAETYGPHGGHFPWHEHLLCAEYFPLPGICSVYVLARKLGANRQDRASRRYSHFITSVEAAASKAPPLVFAAGHEHGLQVNVGSVATVGIVSGSGSRTAFVGHGEPTLFSQADHGFAVVDRLRDGRVALRVFSIGGREDIGAPVYADIIFDPSSGR